MDEALKFAIENGIINLSYVQDKYEMNKREKILSNHKWAIGQGKDGKWRTYIPDGPNGRRMIKKSSRSDLEDAVIAFYKKKKEESEDKEKYKFKIRFEIWVDRQKMCERSDNTIYKYYTDYKRFFEGRKIEDMDIRKIDNAIIMSTFKEVLQEKEIPFRALKGAFGYVNGVFEKSIIDRVTTENPCKYVDLPLLKKYCIEKSNNCSERRTVSESEKEKIFKKIERSSNVIKYAVEFAFCTGMRVGELSSLKWQDVDFEKRIVKIQSSEKHSRITNEYYISETKNEKVRVIPLTDDMEDILQRTKDHELKHGWICEFVFSGECGRIHASAISDWMRNNTMTKEFENTKSIHAIRRTINSKMRCAGVPPTVAASILGHTEKVNEENYTYDITSMEEKSSILTMAAGMKHSFCER